MRETTSSMKSFIIQLTELSSCMCFLPSGEKMYKEKYRHRQKTKEKGKGKSKCLYFRIKKIITMLTIVYFHVQISRFGNGWQIIVWPNGFNKCIQKDFYGTNR